MWIGLLRIYLTARKEFSTINTGSTDEFSQEFKENLTQYALSKLKEDSYYS